MISFLNWLKMGGYFPYIWPAYGFALLILGLNLWALRIKKIKTKEKLQAWFKRQEYESRS
ncbi:MAG: heme exporter protein CcmD [Proteobacteria bacterium]|nr:heme exporter protein CcmD [Pseudomonadota bacterium]